MPKGTLKELPFPKMEFFNIQSSAALIYDEFIQNAGKYHKEKALTMTVACYYTAYAVSTVVSVFMIQS